MTQVVMDISEVLLCPHCDYNVQGLSSNRCPECGKPFDLQALRQTQIPWSLRSEMGRLRAYYRTVWRATFRTRKFSQEVHRPVNYRDARLFQIVTLLHVWLAVLLLSGAYAVAAWNDALGYYLAMSTHAVLVVAANILILPFLLLLTGVHTYWFHPKEVPTAKQNRAVSLSYYCCAPLAFVFPAMASLLLLYYFDKFAEELFGMHDLQGMMLGVRIVAFIVFVALILAIVDLWMLPLLMMRHTGIGKSGGVIAYVLLSPLIWLTLTAIFFVVIPYGISLVYLYILTVE